MIELEQMRTWAEIDLDALAHNYRALRAMTRPGCGFMGLVKADAYGHGSLPVAQALEALGAEMLAVASVSEGVYLREHGIVAPILCLGQTPRELAELVVRYGITQTVEDLDTGRALSAAAVTAGKRVKLHVKLDTGMSRLGFFWANDGDNTTVLKEIVQLCTLPQVEAEGLYTHFAAADDSEDYTMEQLTRFLDAKQALEQRNVHFTIYHCGSSAAVLNYPCTHMDMIRPGIALYGYYPAPELEGLDGVGLKPVMQVKSRIAAVHTFPAGTCVSYGCTATLTRDSRLAVVSIGYGDGYPRQLSNRMDMVLHGVPCPIVGRVCMDMCMVDVTDLPQVQAGDVALVYGLNLTQRAAQLTDTIVYELLCRISSRVPRIYLKQGAGIP